MFKYPIRMKDNGQWRVFIIILLFLVIVPGFSNPQTEKYGTKSYIHGPVAVGYCDVCHLQEGADFKAELVDKEWKLCLDCHEHIIPQFLLPYLHGPFSVGECTDCHDPHEADYKFLLKEDAKMALCLGCHEDMAKKISSSNYVHKALIEFGCLGCHEPHASHFVYMLKRSERKNQICLYCHKNKMWAHRQHPVEGHPVFGVLDPLVQKKELGCYSCHDPHSSGTENLLRGESKEVFCNLCHEFTT